ncbi:hypothetical protein [Aridibaculum aurantiacum]|uniref:hypothetical protein n=1 Tax=Aridibaculum aurantiacum TaxID=2810307 RepID=UPI001A96AE81|nr:hypothetical protein [Aridibaculum aurantiacum]
MKAIWQQWNFMRILRMVLAIGIIVQGIYTKDTLTIVLGLALGGLALANVGCCGTAGCAVDIRSSNTKTTIEYEELDIKK